jgi:hypothetical protein
LRPRKEHRSSVEFIFDKDAIAGACGWRRPIGERDFCRGGERKKQKERQKNEKEGKKKPHGDIDTKTTQHPSTTSTETSKQSRDIDKKLPLPLDFISSYTL